MSLFHKDAPTGDIHQIHQWAYADATAKAAASGFASSDVGKVALQIDTATYYILTAATPTWQKIGAISLTDVLSIVETSFTIANNQGSAANVTGLSFSGSSVRSFVVDYQIYRNTTSTGATELSEAGLLIGAYSTVAASWEMQQAPVVGDAGVTLTITSAGQVQYTSTNITGTAATSKMTFKARTMGV